MIFHHHSRTVLKGRVGLPNWKNFRKSAKGGGAVIFNPKIDVAVFGNFKQGFSIMKLIQNSNFRVQGMFFQQLYREESKQDTLEEGSSSHNSLRVGSSYQIERIFGKGPNGS